MSWLIRHLLIWAAVAAYLFAIAVMVPARAAECPEAMQFAYSEQYVNSQVEAGKATNMVVMMTTVDVDRMLTLINATYNRALPLGAADRAIAFVLDGRFFLFGYRDGCQIGWFVLDQPLVKPMKSEDA